MKHTLAIILFLSVLFAGCDQSTTAQPEGYVTCIIDGVKWEADVLPTALFDEVLGNYSVHGSHEGTQTSLVLDAHAISGPGTYDLNDLDHGARFRDFLNLKDYKTQEDLDGTLVIITMNDSGTRGTFSFDARNTEDEDDIIEVRNGEFNVQFFD